MLGRVVSAARTEAVRPTYPESFDNSRAVTEFGWKITGLKETVRAHIDGVRAEADLATPAG